MYKILQSRIRFHTSLAYENSSLYNLWTNKLGLFFVHFLNAGFTNIRGFAISFPMLRVCTGLVTNIMINNIVNLVNLNFKIY